VHQAASGAFIHGLSAGCLVAGGVAIAGAIMAAALLPAQPESWSAGHPPAQAQPAAVLTD
ncbi:MAG: MFS transporter, partial [Solirubrobacterales bacterium]